ncbi:MAG: ATP-binding cassette domain-containing protein [Planctomycetaceae bacterium]|nr:ATP-binding cassette domain-containing protein [Planctomycetaceae bacterium]
MSNYTLRVSFNASSERLGLLGASGCGKSITLKCIAGIVQPDSGRIVSNGRVFFDSVVKINLPPQERHIGLLFQQYALFPTMTVRENMEIVLKNKGITRHERNEQVDKMIERFRLSEFVNLRPYQLSGGQQQRAAMSRMLISSPELIMLDEPFSALDSFLRYAVEAELMEMLETFAGTILFVSHNRDEIYRICERMLILQDGKTAAFGTTKELFRNPGTLAAARLTGVKNIAKAVATNEGKVKVADWGLELQTDKEIPNGEIYAAIRAHHIREVLPNETVNCFDFDIVRKQSEPFRIQELLTLSTKHDHLENNNTKIKPLVRLISGAQDPIFKPQDKTTKLCLPPNNIMILTESPL